MHSREIFARWGPLLDPLQGSCGLNGSSFLLKSPFATFVLENKAAFSVEKGYKS